MNVSEKQCAARLCRERHLAVCAALVVGLAGCTSTAATAPTTPQKSPLDAPIEALTADVPESPATAAAAPKLGPQANALDSTIRKVTVYSDRALVTRQATADVAAGSKVYAFTKLPGWVDDGSVRVSTTAGRIIDVRVKRTYLARATDKAYQRAEDEARELSEQMAALSDEIQILDAQTKQIEDIKAFSMDKITKDMTVGDISVESYGQVVDFVAASLRKTAKERRAIHRQQNVLKPKIQASQKQLSEVRSLTQLEETTVLVTLESAQKGRATVELTYMLPGATWQPMHELRVAGDNPNSVEVASFAVVTQTSGEDWNHAELSFSTQSSTETVRIPELEALTLGDTKTATRMFKSESASFSRARQAFEGQNRMWNKLQQKSSLRHNFEEVYKSNYDYLQVVQSKTVQLFQSLQKRGTTAHFKTTNAGNVRADGYSVRLPLGRTKLKSKQKIVAAPEQSLNAARTLEMVNASSQPFLPGKVALYQDGAFLGMTDIDFIAEGERFALFLNVADHIKLSRVLDKQQSSVVRKKRTRMQVAFIVSIENLSDKPTSLTLADRIPVSENREIAISKIKVNPKVKPDSRGILTWDLTLQPKESRKFQIGYQIEYPPTLILETKRKRDYERARRKNRKKKRPSRPRMYDLSEDIADLEQSL